MSKDVNQLARDGKLTSPDDGEGVEYGADGKPKKVAIPLIGASAVFAPLPPPLFLVPKLEIGPGRPTMIAGYGAAGKTIAVQSLALSIAAGREFWPSPASPKIGFGSTNRVKVIHLDRDQGKARTLRTYQRLAAGMGITQADLDGWLYVSPFPEIAFDDATWKGHLKALAKAHTTDGVGPLVILDAFVGFLGGLEENDTESSKPLYELGALSEDTKATFMILHHARKTGANETSSKMSIRGSSSLFGAIDNVLVLEAGREKYGKGISAVSHEKAPFVTQELFGLRISDAGEPRMGPLYCEWLKTEEMENLEKAMAKEAKARKDAAKATMPKPGGAQRDYREEVR